MMKETGSLPWTQLKRSMIEQKNKKPVILIAEPDYSVDALKKYRSMGSVFFWFGAGTAERAEYLKKAEILVVRLKMAVDKKLIDKMPHLRIIATSTTGLNHIDTGYAAEKGIKVISLRGEMSFLKNIPSTAEETWGLIISLLRNIPWAYEDVKKGNWDLNRWQGEELRGKTIGILGFGRLGKIVAKYARAFGMIVLACDPNVSASEMARAGAKKTDMDNLFRSSDIVSLHVLLTEATKNLVKMRHLRMMRSSAYLVNTARAELLEKGALFSALKNKLIKGAAIDVLDDEKENGAHLKNEPLIKYAKEHSNLIILPHIGGNTREAMNVTQDFVAGLVAKHIGKKI